MDEVANVVEEHQISKSDFEILQQDFIWLIKKPIKSNGMKAKRLLRRILRNKKAMRIRKSWILQWAIMMWLFPVRNFNAFRNIYILTYMFNAQMQRYYDYYKLPYKFIYVIGDDIDNYCFSEIKENINTR